MKEGSPATTARASAWSIAAIAALVLSAGLLAACGDEGENGPLTIYSGREEEYAEKLYEIYEEETGNELEVRYGDSAELAATILEEGDNTPADVFFSQDAGALGALQDEGRFSELDEELLARLEPRFRSDQGSWVGVSGRARVIAYDSRELSGDDLPASVLGLADPEWEGRVGWAPTNASFQAFVTALRLSEGDDAAREWLEAMEENGAEAFADNSSIRDAIAAGEIDIGLVNHYYVAQAQAEEGESYPVEVFFPRGGDVGALINVAGIGVLTGTDEENQARDFVDFLLSPRSQRYWTDEIKEYPLVTGVEADSRLVPLARIEHPQIDLSDLDDLQGTLKLIEEAGVV